MYESRQLDYRETRKRIMKIVEKYQRCLMRIESNAHPKITQSFNVEMPAGGGFNSKTENAAIYAMEGIKPDREFVYEVSDCINRMSDDYREVVWRTYFEPTPHNLMADEMNISASKLSMLKRTATELFAIGMDCEVYEPERN